MRSSEIPPRKWETSEALRRAQGFLCALCFMMLLAGTNIPTPLLPLYRDVVGLAPVIVSLTYSIYVATLVAVLLLFSRPSMVRHYPLLLVSAIILAVGADLMLATGTMWGILAGRAVTGISGGIGTGAASALVVAALGEKGRALSATGNLAGAVLGTALSQLFLDSLGVAALRINFELHAAVCLLLLVPLIATLVWRKGENRSLFGRTDLAPEKVLPVLATNAGPIGCGVLSWITISLSVVLLPTFFADHSMNISQAAGIPVMLASSLVAQLASPILPMFLRKMKGLGATISGVVLIFVGSWAVVDYASLIGLALVGFGAGFSYRTSLVTLCRGCSPALQGRLATLYAAITYAFAAAIVLFGGWFVQNNGQYIAILTLFSVTAFLSIVIGRWAPSLSDIRQFQ